MISIKLDKKDYSRALLTDTYPADTPIIFSNDGLYINGHIVRSGKTDLKSKVVSDIYMLLIEPSLNGALSVDVKCQAQLKQTKPFKYKIIKNEVSLRTLSLIHPRSQINYINIYKEHSDYLVSLFEKSSFSIRSPMRVCNSFYLKGEEGVIYNSYKEVNIETIMDELYKKHASSYFSYKGFTRIYKLYSSPLFKELEAQFPLMFFLDVANCFDSIYTHTIAWAAKEKNYIKDHFVDWKNQFSQKLDTTMQRSNANETNGIPIGSEFSRIFAEIIFQQIDVNIEKGLKNDYAYINEVDYRILRYVDDYIVFGMTEEICKDVSNVISDNLADYNLFVNSDKTYKLERPFCTNKSKIIISLSSCLDYFEKALFQKEHLANRKYYASQIYKKHNFMNKFMNEVRLIALSSDENGYSEVSSYLVSFLSKRVESLIYDYTQYISNGGRPGVFVSGIEILLELMLFYYKVHPAINSSNKIAKTVISSVGFFESQEDLLIYIPLIKDLVTNSIKTFTFDFHKNGKRKGYFSIERLNVILSTSDFEPCFKLPSDYFKTLVKSCDNLNYFETIALLYYFKNHSEYDEIKLQVIKSSMEKIVSYDRVKDDSELVHLILDLSTCPYVPIENRLTIFFLFYTNINMAITPTQEVLNNYINATDGVYWFVNWKSLNIKQLIERNELKSQY